MASTTRNMTTSDDSNRNHNNKRIRIDDESTNDKKSKKAKSSPSSTAKTITKTPSPFEALPYELRHMIYQLLEPIIMVAPQLPHFAKDPKRQKHPLLQVCRLFQADIRARYCNHNNPGTPAFLPKAALFIYFYGLREEPRSRVDVENFFAHDPRNAGLIKHMNLIVDNFYGAEEGEAGENNTFAEILHRFPNLETLRVTLRYDYFAFSWSRKDRNCFVALMDRRMEAWMKTWKGKNCLNWTILEDKKCIHCGMGESERDPKEHKLNIGI